MDQFVSMLLEPVKAFVSAHLNDGAAALFVIFLFGVLRVFFDQYKEALSARVKVWLKSGHNLLAISLYLVGAVLLYGTGRWWTFGAFSAVVAGYVLARAWRPAIVSGKGRLPIGLASALLFLFLAYTLDLVLEKRRYQSFDVAFLLPPDFPADGAPKDPQKLFAGLKERLNVSFSGVNRVRIVPEKLTGEDFSRYTFERANDLLAYRTAEGYPKVFIRNRYNVIPGDPNRLQMLVVPYQRRAGADRIEPLMEWKLRPLVGSEGKMAGVELRSYFDLIMFLGSKQLIALTPEAQQTIWKNILSEYGQFLARYASKCPVLEELSRLPTEGLTEREIRDLLNAPCPGLDHDPGYGTRQSDREYANVEARFRNPSR